MKAKPYRCKKCGRYTTTTNEKVFEMKLCGTCRKFIIPLLHGEEERRDKREQERRSKINDYALLTILGLFALLFLYRLLIWIGEVFMPEFFAFVQTEYGRGFLNGSLTLFIFWVMFWIIKNSLDYRGEW